MTHNTKAYKYYGGALFFSAFAIAIAATDPHFLKYFTDWTLIAHSLLLLFMGIYVRENKAKNIPASYFLYAWALPSMLCIEISVAAGSFGMELMGDMARQALKDHPPVVVWTYNAVEHFLTLLALVVFISVDLEFYKATAEEFVPNNSTSEYFRVWVAMTSFFVAYSTLYNPVHVYGVSLERYQIILIICGVQTFSLFLFYLILFKFIKIKK